MIMDYNRKMVSYHNMAKWMINLIIMIGTKEVFFNDEAFVQIKGYQKREWLAAIPDSDMMLSKFRMQITKI